MFIDYLVLMSSFCTSNSQFSYSQIDKITCNKLIQANTHAYSVQTSPIRRTLKCTYDRICLKGFGMEQVITQLAVKILFDDYSGFYDMRRTIILPKKQK